MWLHWPSLSLRWDVTFWEIIIDGLPIVAAILCAAWLLKMGACRVIALFLIGVFCVQLWSLVLDPVEAALWGAGVFSNGVPVA